MSEVATNQGASAICQWIADDVAEFPPGRLISV